MALLSGFLASQFVPIYPYYVRYKKANVKNDMYRINCLVHCVFIICFVIGVLTEHCRVSVIYKWATCFFTEGMIRFNTPRKPLNDQNKFTYI